MTEKTTDINDKKDQLEGSAYDLIRGRLLKNADDLRSTLDRLNESRKEIFGTVDFQLTGTDRVTTENNCIPYDMVPVGNRLLFGYNVLIGLKSQTKIEDVFSIYEYKDQSFHQSQNDLLNDAQFHSDFTKLYKYYRETRFMKFATRGAFLYMVFRFSEKVEDIKAFKWAIHEDSLTYVDDRSPHEFTFPSQHQFEWKKTTRDQHREGKHPHVSIEDKVFVETINGNLTLKVEDNTEEGQGVYEEEVDNKDQTLDDSTIFYAVVHNLVLLKILPYQEEEYRYIIYNTKLQQARRFDSLKDACMLLPEDHGVIFTNGYYLQTGVFKKFENNLSDMLFEQMIASPNGEDYLYVFYNREEGLYLLLPYNIISQKVENPITCHGYSIFENGQLIYFKADDTPKKHHALQIWQTPFLGADFQSTQDSDQFLFKVGNKEIVKAMSECQELLVILGNDENYLDLYYDIQRRSTDVLDSYYWLNHDDAFHLDQSLVAIHDNASAALEEFEKVNSIRQNTKKQVAEVTGAADALMRKIDLDTPKKVQDFVQYLSDIRSVRGQVLSLKDLRYVDEESVVTYEDRLAKYMDKTSDHCVRFLLRDDALKPYHEQITQLEGAIEAVKKVVKAEEVEKEIDQFGRDLELLIEVVSNLKIKDATQTTRIIDAISAIFSIVNKLKAKVRNKRKDLLSEEGKAEFGSQMKLVDQAVINYLEVSDTPEKVEEYLTKIMIQLEELEGKFAEFDEFISEIGGKREEVYEAFESKKVALTEARNKRAQTLFQSAERIINAASKRAERMKEFSEINGYFASDIMVDKARNIIQELLDMGDSVKADDLQSRLKSSQEEAIRQLKDRSELFVDGANIIQFGNHQFTVNTKNLEATIIARDNKWYYHLTGTNFYEEIPDEEFQNFTDLRDQTLISESKEVYRSEYLAYAFIKSIASMDGPVEISDYEHFFTLSDAQLLEKVQEFMSKRYAEGYVKGIHDHDAFLLIKELLRLIIHADLLRYHTDARAMARLYWEIFLDKEVRQQYFHRLKGTGIISRIFRNTSDHQRIVEEIRDEFSKINAETKLFKDQFIDEAAEYTFYEITRGDQFIIGQEASELYETFDQYVSTYGIKKDVEESMSTLTDSVDQFIMIKKWFSAFLENNEKSHLKRYVNEAVVLWLTKGYESSTVIKVDLHFSASGLLGGHGVIEDKSYSNHLNEFNKKLIAYDGDLVPRFEAYQASKKQLVKSLEDQLRLSEFKPQIMSAFVRNQLIDKVYLPLIGANLAKQIGSVGENKRTDRMGMLLLISPPGYGKTTLMEYIAERLGLIFVKINGPAVGHNVVSLDPAEATNAGAREELNRLSLAFEMGDNVMIYLDDIQHCNPEFLQKFISLSDAQRKIEGVYKGKSRTYDFRGKKVAVVMAGNPYTESGDKFQIPDMLANRADIYNLGDILGNTDREFKLSYLENCLTSNTVLHKLAGKSHKDVLSLIKVAETGQQEGVEFEANHSTAEINEYVGVLKKLLQIRDIVLRVNQEYIYSAGQAEEYRTEPPFKLQGSYRNMNKIAEKVVPLMNDKELQTLINSHYENEAQTLTTGAEANVLKFKELIGSLTKEEAKRWEEIKLIFQKQQRVKGMGSNQQMAHMLEQVESIIQNLAGIKDALKKP